MSKICEMCGKRPTAGRSYARRGLAKSKGGVGRKVTGITKRLFSPNVQRVRVVDGKGTVRRARICTKCLRTGLRQGTIAKAVRSPRPAKEVAPPEGVPPEALTEAEQGLDLPEADAERTGEIEVPPEANAIDGDLGDESRDEPQSGQVQSPEQ